jgi:hypothetical protein
LCRAFALALGDRDVSHSSDLVFTFVWLLITCLSFSVISFIFLFSLNWLLVCVVNALMKGEIEDSPEDRWMCRCFGPATYYGEYPK